jgi:hypothetical protein
MSKLVERFGRTGFAALSSIIWALPMAAWAGSADLSPVDKTATPTIAFSIGVVMLIVWFVLVASLRRFPVSTRQRRFDVGQMSSSEKRWTLACAAFATGLIAWLNAAATVDWGPLGSAISAGKVGPIVFAIALALFAIAMVVGIAITWSKESRAYRTRTNAASA